MCSSQPRHSKNTFRREGHPCNAAGSLCKKEAASGSIVGVEVQGVERGLQEPPLISITLRIWLPQYEHLPFWRGVDWVTVAFPKADS